MPSDWAWRTRIIICKDMLAELCVESADRFRPVASPWLHDVTGSEMSVPAVRTKVFLLGVGDLGLLSINPKINITT